MQSEQSKSESPAAIRSSDGFYTLEDAKKYVAENLDAIMQSYRESKDIPSWARSPRMEECWKAGCWLNMMLKRNHGATAKEVRDIGFAHGQRSAFGDTWKWAVTYANEYTAAKTIKDKPGVELADRINAETFVIV